MPTEQETADLLDAQKLELAARIVGLREDIATRQAQLEGFEKLFAALEAAGAKFPPATVLEETTNASPPSA